MTGIRTVFARASKLVTPKPLEERKMEEIAERMLQRTKDAAKEFPETRGVILGGSFAKGTWLPHDVDLDIFVKLEEAVDERRFEEVGLAVGRRAVEGYKHGKKYAQHPYTEATVDGVKVNVVPCYDVEPGKWRSAADRSQYHVEFVKESTDQDAKTQVRLLKKFMKSVDVYGAEIEREGFSGYAAEVLVLSYRGLEGVLRYFAEIKPEGEVLFSLKDPIDQSRELATAVSKETVAKMVLAARAFLAHPSVDYFEGVKRTVRKDLIKSLYCLRFDHDSLSEDTLWGELKKSTRQVVKHLGAQGFTVVRAAAASDGSASSAIIILPGIDSLPQLEERRGPGVELSAEARKFVSKNARIARLVWAGEDGRLHILQKRRYTSIGALLKGLCGPEIAKVGASREVSAGIQRNGRVLTGVHLSTEASRKEWLRRGVERVVSDSIGTNPPS